MAERVAEGLSIDYTPAADVDEGDIITESNLVAVAPRDIDSGDLGAIDVTGLFSLSDAEIDGDASDVSLGDPVFLSTGEYFGLAAEDGETAATGYVRALLIQNTSSDT